MKNFWKVIGIAALLAVLLIPPIAVHAEGGSCETPASIGFTYAQGKKLTVVVLNPDQKPQLVAFQVSVHAGGEALNYTTDLVEIPPGVSIWDITFDRAITLVLGVSLSSCTCPEEPDNCPPTEGPDPIGREQPGTPEQPE